MVKKKIEPKDRSNENSPEMQETCGTCDELRKNNDLLSSKCQIYEQQIESLGKINDENGILVQESQQKIAKLNQAVALLTQQIAEKITENTMLRLESDTNKGGKVKENNSKLGGNNLPDIDKFLEIKMHTPSEDNLRQKETNKDQDVENNSEMENSDNSDDVQMSEEAEDEETEASSNEKQPQTCAWIVRDDKGTSGCCGKVFPSVLDLVAHFKKDHLVADGHGNYICSWDGCKRNGEPLKSRNIFLNHFRTHPDARPFRCPFKGCNRAFAQSSALSQHKNTHSRTVHPCPEPGCPKVFTHKKHMMVHYRVKHSGESKGFPCPVEGCGKVFEFEHVLRKHFVSHRPYQCRFPRCYRTFTSKQSLDEHSETHEPVAEGHECTFDGCGRKFPDARGVREHVRTTHTGETPYVCPYECGKAFGRERALKRHLNVHTKNTDTVEPP